MSKQSQRYKEECECCYCQKMKRSAIDSSLLTGAQERAAAAQEEVQNEPADVVWDYRPPKGQDYFSHQVNLQSMVATLRDLIYVRSNRAAVGEHLRAGENAVKCIMSLPYTTHFQGPASECLIPGEIVGRIQNMNIRYDPTLPPDVMVVSGQGYEGNTIGRIDNYGKF